MSSERQTAQRWRELDRRHYLHPFTDHRDLRERGSRVITRGAGVYIEDSEGNRILDGMSGLWCVNAGYGRNELIEAAERQLRELPYYNSFFQCAHPPAIELAALLAELAPEHMNNVFYAGSGSEANDTVIRMVRHYWSLRGQPARQTIIARRNAYHGSTVGAASLGGMSYMHEQGGLPIPGIEHIGQPYWYGRGRDMAPADFGVRAARELEQKIREIGADRVAAFVAEPIQGAGGVIIPPDSYWPEVQRICDKYELLLVADEVITGFGRIGHWFASDFYGIRPDLICFAKGITSGYVPLGGVIVSDRITDAFEKYGDEFFHGYTYSGHPVACAVAIANLELLRKEKIIERVRDDVGPYFELQWNALADHPLVGEARSKGLIAGLELVADKDSARRFPKGLKIGDQARDISVEQGLVMRAVGDTMIAAPPLVISRAEIDELIEKARRVLDLTAKKIGR